MLAITAERTPANTILPQRRIERKSYPGREASQSPPEPVGCTPAGSNLRGREPPTGPRPPKSVRRQLVELATGVFGRTVMQTEIKNFAEIDNCTSKQQTVYDLATSTTNHQVRRRCLGMLNALNGEAETYIPVLWPNTPDHRRT
jgi:hypothetical protein